MSTLTYYEELAKLTSGVAPQAEPQKPGGTKISFPPKAEAEPSSGFESNKCEIDKFGCGKCDKCKGQDTS